MVRSISALFVAFICTTSALAELTPDQIAIIARSRDTSSENVAKYYANIRKVPPSQILAMPFPDGETMDRAEWESKYRPAIRKWLRDKKLGNQIKCFVTVWGVPLRIGKSEGDSELRKHELFLKGEWNGRIKRLNQVLVKLHAIQSTGDEAPELTDESTLEQVRDAFQQSFVSAQERAAGLEDEQAKQAVQGELQNYYVAVTGLSGVSRGLAQSLASTVTPDPQVRAQINVANGRLMGFQETRMLLDAMPVSIERDLRLASVVERAEGIFGALGWLNQQIELASRKENWSSFDSELTMVAFSDYSTIRWQPNYLNVQYRDSGVRGITPTFMVARIDAPSLARARQIMDDALKVEKTGLIGKAYFDSRGLYKPDTQITSGSYADYDRSVVQCADLLKQHSTLEVVLNDKNELFQAGECPDAAIYCGWYSLGNYIDAFDWAAGSVGYHIASSEASTLKNSESNVWCKAMLEDGICATLGPVYEPYLPAFPRPEQFFLMLLSGKYTLAECFYATNPYNSWTMTLLGDPLYNPFKAKPALKFEELPAQLKNFLDIE